MLIYTGCTHVAEPKDHYAGELSPAGGHQVTEAEVVNEQNTLFLAG